MNLPAGIQVCFLSRLPKPSLPGEHMLNISVPKITTRGVVP